MLSIIDFIDCPRRVFIRVLLRFNSKIFRIGCSFYKIAQLAFVEDSFSSRGTAFTTANTASRTTAPRKTPAMLGLDSLCHWIENTPSYNALKRKICQNVRTFVFKMMTSENKRPLEKSKRYIYLRKSSSYKGYNNAVNSRNIWHVLQFCRKEHVKNERAKKARTIN